MGGESIVKFTDFTDEQLTGCVTRLLDELSTRGVDCTPMLRDAMAKQHGISNEEKLMVESGRFIEAIKHHRIRRQSSLKEAKDVMDAYKNSLQPPPVYYPSQNTTPIRLVPLEHHLIEEGDYLGAIKEVRTRCGISLIDARTIVDKYKNLSSREAVLERKAAELNQRRGTMLR